MPRPASGARIDTSAGMIVDVHEEKDDGLRRLLIWTFVALVLAVAMAVVGVQIVTHLFDPG